MDVNILTTKDEVGKERLKRLLPQLKALGAEYKLHYEDLELDPMEYAHRGLQNILKKNKDQEYFIYIEDDAIINEKLNLKELMDIVDNHKLSTSILSMGSHNYGQFYVLNDESCELDTLYGLQFLVVYKRGYKLIEQTKLGVIQDRHIKGEKGESLRTLVPFKAKQDNLGGSRIKRYKRAELDFLGRYEDQMISEIKEKYCNERVN